MPTWTINNIVRIPILLIAGVECLVLVSSVYVAGIIVFGDLSNSEEILGPLAPRAVIGASVVLVCLIAMGLYQLDRRIDFHEAALRVMVGVSSGCFIMAAIFYFTPVEMWSNEIALIAVSYTVVLLILVRLVFVKTVDENVFRRRTLLYGAGKRAASISDLRRRADRRGFIVVGTIAPTGEQILCDPVGLVEGDESVIRIAEKLDADEIVVAMDDRRGNLPIRELLDARLRGISVIDLMEFLERETAKIRIDLVQPGWLIFSSGFRTSPFRRFNKRLVDLVVSATLFFLLWPIMLLVAIAIKIEDGIAAPVIYSQERIGRSDKLFRILKFRSMSENAEPDGKAIWAVKDDKRITRVGRFIRKVRLDELPQILNVLSGQMSLVGPRPERPEFVKKLKESLPYYSERHSVQPGITGWAQLHYAYAGSEEDAIEKLQYDLYYVKNHGLVLDILTILQTVEVVLWGKGAR